MANKTKEQKVEDFKGYRTPEALIQEIEYALSSGETFSPFVGAGLSSNSGIMMGTDFRSYLAYTLCRCLLPQNEQIKFFKLENENERRDLRLSGWPAFPKRTQANASQTWVKNIYLELLKKQLPETEYKKIESIIAAKNKPIHLELIHHVKRPLVPECLLSLEGFDQIAKLDEEIVKFWSVTYGFDAKAKLSEFTPRPGQSPASIAYIIEAGIRSLCDWRSTLSFLSRIELTDNQVFLHEKPEQRLIDSFNRHLGAGRIPGLGHQMLVNLARPLRTEVLFTTNFDTLIEDAFKSSHFPIETIPVSLQGELPDPGTVRSKRTLIKLHGTQHETRSDWSLDRNPSAYECSTFAEYLNPENKRYIQSDSNYSSSVKQHSRNLKNPPNNLLVLGFSGGDQRIVSYIKAALDIRPETKIFWIANSAGTACKVIDTFDENQLKEGVLYNESLLISITTRTDLFLYELYQILEKRLPSSAFTYQFQQYIPVWRTAELVEKGSPKDQLKDNFEKFFKEYYEQLERNTSADDVGWGEAESDQWLHVDFNRPFLRANGSSALTKAATGKSSSCYLWRPKPTQAAESATGEQAGSILLYDIYRGASERLQPIFNKLVERRKQCMWLELEDFPNASSVATEILHLLSWKKGLFLSEHVDLQVTSGELTEDDNGRLRDRIKTITTRYLDISASEWFIFFYGRSAPGSCSGIVGVDWNQEEARQFHTLVRVFAQCGYNIIYMPFSLCRQKYFEARQNKIYRELGYSPQAIHSIYPVRSSDIAGFTSQSSSPFFYAQSAPSDEHNLTFFSSILSWLNDEKVKLFREKLAKEQDVSSYYKKVIREADEYKVNFLYGLALFRQSRHPASLITEGVYSCPYRYNLEGIDNDHERHRNASQWINELVERDLFYRKPGGYFWIYGDVRQCIIWLFETFPVNTSVQVTRRAKVHYLISDWFSSAFSSSSHGLPLTETLYHLFSAIRWTDRVEPSKKYSEIDHRKEFRLDLLNACLSKLIKNLRAARFSFKYWAQALKRHDLFSAASIADGLGLPVGVDGLRVTYDSHAKLEQWLDSGFTTWINDKLRNLTPKEVPLDPSLPASKQTDRAEPIQRTSDEATARENIKKRLGSLFQTMRAIHHELNAEGEDLGLGSLNALAASDASPSFQHLSMRIWSSSQNSSGSKPGDQCNLVDHNREMIREFYRLLRKDNSLTFDLDQVIQLLTPFKWSGRNDLLLTLCALGISVEKNDDLGNGSLVRDATKKMQRSLLANFRDVPQNLIPVAELFRQHAYFLIRHAKLVGRLWRILAEAQRNKVFEDERSWKNLLENLSQLRLIGGHRFDAAHPENRDEIIRNSLLALQEGLKYSWRAATISCRLAMELLIHADPARMGEEIELRFDLHTIYGLAVSHLNRFSEAQRRFTEAGFSLNNLASGDVALRRSIIHLRRAEADINQARYYSHLLGRGPGNGIEYDPLTSIITKSDFLQAARNKDSTNIPPNCTRWDPATLYPKTANSENVTTPGAESSINLANSIYACHIASINDAISQLDAAEKNLSGNSYSTLWWSRLCNLRLRTFETQCSPPPGVSPQITLAYRERVDPRASIREWFEQGIHLASHDPYRRLRIINLYKSALVSYHKNSPSRDLRQRCYCSFAIGIVCNACHDGIEQAYLDFATTLRANRMIISSPDKPSPINDCFSSYEIAEIRSFVLGNSSEEALYAEARIYLEVSISLFARMTWTRAKLTKGEEKTELVQT